MANLQVEASWTNSTANQLLVAADAKNKIVVAGLSLRNEATGVVRYQIIDGNGGVWLDVDVPATSAQFFPFGMVLDPPTPGTTGVSLNVKTPTASTSSSTATLVYGKVAYAKDSTAP